MPSTGKSQYLQDDPALVASAAGDAFGGGSGNAELLIAANQLRWSQHLEAAQLNVADADATAELDRADVVGAIGVDDKLVHSYAVHGSYVVVVVGPADGRLSKIPLHIGEDGGLERAELEDTPEIAALRAQVQAQAQVEDAKRQAERIIADAQQRANEIAQKAASEAQERAAQQAAEASTSADEEAAADEAVSAGTDGSGDSGSTGPAGDDVDPAEGARTADTPGEPVTRTARRPGRGKS